MTNSEDPSKKLRYMDMLVPKGRFECHHELQSPSEVERLLVEYKKKRELYERKVKETSQSDPGYRTYQQFLAVFTKQIGALERRLQEILRESQ